MKQITFRTEISAHLPEGQMEFAIALLNLLENAIEAEELEEAVSYAYAIKGQGHKYILLENDLTDNY